MTQKTIIVNGEEVPVVPAKAEEEVKNKRTGTVSVSLFATSASNSALSAYSLPVLLFLTPSSVLAGITGTSLPLINKVITNNDTKNSNN